MDMNILILTLILTGISIPLLFGIFLVIARIKLIFINKNILNNAFLGFNIFSMLLFCLACFPVIKNNIQLQISESLIKFENYSLDFGILIDEFNLKLLIFSSLIFLLTGLFAKTYFKIKKQFMFTKRRYWCFLSFIVFNTYAFLLSSNLFQAAVFFILQGVIIFIFSYFDIFKNNANYNIIRSARINLGGDFCLILATLILFKYAIFSGGYIDSSSINFKEINILASYMWGISPAIEFKIMTLAFFIAIMSRFYIFPLNCYFSFLANSSNLFYLTIIPFSGNIFGLYLFKKLAFLSELSAEYLNYLELYLFISSLIVLVFILFEKNIKIIFGHIISFTNAIFIISYFKFDSNFVIYIYMIVNLFLFFILSALFIKDKLNFKRRLINKQKGFILEKIHIVLFECIPEKLYYIFNFIDEKAVQNIFPSLIKIINYFSSFFVVKCAKVKLLKSIRGILIIFAIVALISIFIALFGRFKC